MLTCKEDHDLHNQIKSDGMGGKSYESNFS